VREKTVSICREWTFTAYAKGAGHFEEMTVAAARIQLLLLGKNLD